MMIEEHFSIDSEKPFLAFSLPGEQVYSLHLVSVKKDILSQINLEKYDFIIAPFLKESDCYYLQFENDLGHIPFSYFSSHSNSYFSVGKNKYLDIINNIIVDMKSNAYQKLVLSRIQIVPNEERDLGLIFNEMVKLYPNAFTFIYNLPGIGCWMGASPETLLKENKNHYETVALAGTQKLNMEVDLVKWGEKEIEEQQYIQDFIERFLSDHQSAFTKSDTYTSEAGNVCHLKTEYYIEKQNQSLANLIDGLHPSPAICGTPQEAALGHIKKYEMHDRSFYCGYLGLLSEGSVNLFVNLRSMSISKDCFALFLGGGITVNSDAESEWKETELKGKTMESVLKNQTLNFN